MYKKFPHDINGIRLGNSLFEKFFRKLLSWAGKTMYQRFFQVYANQLILKASYLVPYFSYYKTHFFPPNLGGKWECVLQSKCSLPGSLEWGGSGGAAGSQEAGPHFLLQIFSLFSSSETQICLMVQCIIQSKKYGKFRIDGENIDLSLMISLQECSSFVIFHGIQD